MFTRILVPLDGSALAERALPYATRLAGATGGVVSLLHVTSDLATPHRPRVELDVATQLEHLAARLQQDGMKAAALTAHGDAAEAIVETAEGTGADTIVMSTHGRGGLGRLLYGSVADYVLRHVRIPVLLVSAGCRHVWPEDRPLRLLVPLDGSETSEAALPSARALGERLGADLVLLRSVAPTSAPSLAFDPEYMHLEMARPSETLDEASDYLDALAMTCRPAVRSVDIVVDVGEPAARIADAARREKVDLVVMATHGRSGLSRLTMGSISAATLRRVRVPILLVRPVPLHLPAAAQEAAVGR